MIGLDQGKCKEGEGEKEEKRKKETEESGVGNFNEEGTIAHSALEGTEGSGTVEFNRRKTK